jgi:hypothetical protein
MIRQYLDSVRLGVIEALFEKIGTGATLKEIQMRLPRNAKYPQRVLDSLTVDGLAVCENPEAVENERIYHGNTKSKIFTSLFTIDMALDDIEHERKKKLRALMFSPKKKVE